MPHKHLTVEQRYIIESGLKNGVSKKNIANGLLREFIPKGTDIANVTENDLHYYITLINTRPRKVLNWQTAQVCHYVK